jgi:predicted dehydrogenase
MSTPIRLGVIGYGGRIDSVIKYAIRAVAPDTRVTAIVDPNEAAARERLADCDKADVVFYKNVKEMVRSGKIDALAIGTRCGLHTPYAIEVAQYDLPLFLEKPVATSIKQTQQLEKAFRKSKCPVVVSFPLRVSPLCTLTRRYIADGAVGTPGHILATNYVNYGTVYFDEFYRDYASTQGLFLQKATHDLDYVSFLMDSPIVRVGAMMTTGQVFGGKKRAGLRCSQCKDTDTCLESPANRKRNLSGGTTDDHCCTFGKDITDAHGRMNEDASSALLEFASGAHGVYTQIFYSRRDAGRRGAVISGYDGTLDFDWYTNLLKRVRHHEPFTDTIKAAEGMNHFGGDVELGRDFVNVILGKGKSRTPIQTGLASAYMCLACRESAQTGKFVNVQQVGF